MRGTLLPFVLVFLICGCNTEFADAQASRPNPGATTQAQSTRDQQSDILKAIAALDAEISQAESEAGKYSGGLVKALIDSRVATLKQTRAMLDQRAKSWTFGIGLRYNVDGRVFTPPADAAGQLAAVEAEINTLRAQIDRQQAEADRYSGGLVQAMSHATVATSRQTLAMLEQKRLALKFGLPQFIGFADVKSPAAPTSSASPITPAATPAPPIRSVANVFEIVSVDSRVTESNSSWSRYAWKVTIKNKDTVPHSFQATIEFQDGDGFVVDDDTEYGLVVPAASEQTFTGYDLVDASVAGKVARTNAKVGLTK